MKKKKKLFLTCDVAIEPLAMKGRHSSGVSMSIRDWEEGQAEIDARAPIC